MTHHQVIIIGAGIAGLAAAELLAEKEVDYVILEARDRIGGRIQTCKDGLAPYDMGASWAHDTLANPLFDKVLASRNSSAVDKYNLYYDDQRPLYFSLNQGPKFFDHHKIEQVVHELEKFIELAYFEEIDKKDVSLKDIISQYITKQRNLLTEEQIRFVPQLARHLELWHGIGWNEMSSKFGLVDNVGRNCLFRNGYSTVIADITARLDQSRIHKQAVVQKINSSKSQIQVVLDNNTELTADWIICTVPQSILQLELGEVGAIEWTPKLPCRIKESLENMSWGKLGKIVFEFEHAWWKHHDTDRFVALATPDDYFARISDDISNMDIKKSERNESLPRPWDFPVLILNLYKVYGVPALLCFTQGKLTEYIEKNPDEAWSYMKPIVSKLSINDLDAEANVALTNISPSKTIVSQWTVDPFSRGSYAACKPNNDPTDLVIQLERGIGNIRFAGEHTILDGAGAVHGAWMSGRRESTHILIKEGIIEGEVNEF